jgi:hypothetical protein
VASVLGVPANRVVSKTKRLGGGFGGKETRGIFLHCAAAVPAYHLRRPVRITLDRDEDMQMSGELWARLESVVNLWCMHLDRDEDMQMSSELLRQLQSTHPLTSVSSV